MWYFGILPVNLLFLSWRIAFDWQCDKPSFPTSYWEVRDSDEHTLCWFHGPGLGVVQMFFDITEKLVQLSRFLFMISAEVYC